MKSPNKNVLQSKYSFENELDKYKLINNGNNNIQQDNFENNTSNNKQLNFNLYQTSNNIFNEIQNQNYYSPYSIDSPEISSTYNYSLNELKNKFRNLQEPDLLKRSRFFLDLYYRINNPKLNQSGLNLTNTIFPYQIEKNDINIQPNINTLPNLNNNMNSIKCNIIPRNPLFLDYKYNNKLMPYREIYNYDMPNNKIDFNNGINKKNYNFISPISPSLNKENKNINNEKEINYNKKEISKKESTKKKVNFLGKKRKLIKKCIDTSNSEDEEENQIKKEENECSIDNNKSERKDKDENNRKAKSSKKKFLIKNIEKVDKVNSTTKSYINKEISLSPKINEKKARFDINFPENYFFKKKEIDNFSEKTEKEKSPTKSYNNIKGIFLSPQINENKTIINSPENYFFRKKENDNFSEKTEENSIKSGFNKFGFENMLSNNDNMVDFSSNNIDFNNSSFAQSDEESKYSENNQSIRNLKDEKFIDFEKDLKDYLRRIISIKRQNKFFKSVLPESLEIVKKLFVKNNNIAPGTVLPIYKNDYLELSLAIENGGIIKKRVSMIKP